MSVDSDINFNFALVIKTNAYSGNFERELCAYATGAVGECDVGDDAAKIYRKESPEELHALSDITARKPDDNGCWRPASIWRGDDDSYNSVIIFLESIPEPHELEHIVARIRAFPAYSAKQKYGQKNLEILKIELIERQTVITDTLLKTL